MTERRRPRPTPVIWVSALLWLGLAAAFVTPIAVALNSPLLAWRDPVYIAAGFAGVFAMALLLLQPMLIGGYLAGFSGIRGRRMHRWVGSGLLIAVFVHVAGLWVTSPPDVIDALLFRSPTPFSVWGVIALWAVLAAALLAGFRRRLQLSSALWRFAHTAMAMIVVVGSVIHALQIEGTMGTASKVMLCSLVIVATGWVILDLQSWGLPKRKR
ncbi:MAG: ferric reductase-like transmembrane domain-containing protein [Granulosicoccus sp.]